MGWRATDYPMDTADILTLIGGIGGMQGIIELLKWWRGRKLRDRYDIADVKAAEDENSRRQVDWLEKRLAERDAQIDHILYHRLKRIQMSFKLHLSAL